jgi:hypothetical protein
LPKFEHKIQAFNKGKAGSNSLKKKKTSAIIGAISFSMHCLTLILMA